MIEVLLLFAGIGLGYLVGQVREWSRVLDYISDAPDDEPLWQIRSGIAVHKHRRERGYS